MCAVDIIKDEQKSRAYLAMNRTDPDAIWMYQGWIVDKSKVGTCELRWCSAPVRPSPHFCSARFGSISFLKPV